MAQLASVQKLAAVATRVASPGAQRSWFKGAGLQGELQAAAADLARPGFWAAYKAAGPLRSQAMQLATKQLPAALAAHFAPFLAPGFVGLAPADLLLPEPLCFTLLHAHADLCLALLVSGAATKAEQGKLMLGAVHTLDAILTASGASYGFGMSLAMGSDPWADLYGSYGNLFFVRPVESQEVLQAISDRNLDGFLEPFGESWVESAAADGVPGMSCDWLKRLPPPRKEGAAPSAGAAPPAGAAPSGAAAGASTPAPVGAGGPCTIMQVRGSLRC